MPSVTAPTTWTRRKNNDDMNDMAQSAKLNTITWICLRGSQKITHINYRFPSHGGFSIGKIKHHLKQTHGHYHEQLLFTV